MFIRSIRAAAMIFLLGWAVACNDNSAAPLPADVPTLTIAPPSATVYEADAVVMTAVLRDNSGGVVPNPVVTWSVNDTVRVQLGANGYMLALKNGVVKVTAASNGVSATYDLTIVRPPVQNVAVLLPTPTITRGDVAMIGVRVDGPGGRVVTGRAVTLASDNPDIATIDASGRVRAISAGVATVRATAEGVSGSAQIVVTGANTVLILSKHNGNSLPVLLAGDSVMYDGVREYHEVYLESGQFTLSGTPLRYSIQMRTAEYNVTTVSGRRVLALRYIQNERDHGLVAYDARGDLQLTSEDTYPLNHSVSPISGGMQMAYRIPGTDDTIQLFFRREPA